MSALRLPVLRTWGPSCNNEYEDDSCDFLLVPGDRCGKFDEQLARDATMDVGLWVRCPACKAATP